MKGVFILNSSEIMIYTYFKWFTKKIIHFSDPFDTSHLDAIIDKEEAEGMYYSTK